MEDYFKRKPSIWNILEFLEFTSGSFPERINSYICSLEEISSHEQGERKKRAQELLTRYKEARFYFLFFIAMAGKNRWRGRDLRVLICHSRLRLSHEAGARALNLR